jgi:hypothetical protein
MYRPTLATTLRIKRYRKSSRGCCSYSLMFWSGTALEFMRRIAAPMVPGMVSAVVLTLVVIPAVFLLWKQHGLKKRARALDTVLVPVDTAL